MKSAGKARNDGLYRHIRTSKEIIRNLLNDYNKYKDIVLKKNPRGDGSYKTTNSINQTHTTPSWNNIANIALYNWTNPVIDKDITTKIHKTSFTFKSYS